MRRLTVFGAIAIGVVGCRSLVLSPRHVDLAMRRAELLQAHDLASARAAGGDFIGAMSEIVAPEGFYVAALFALGDAGRGPAAARTFLDRDTLNRHSRAHLTVVRLDVSADGNDGYSYGYLDVVRESGDTVPGPFKAYWRRRADGKWRALAIARGRRERGPFAAPAEAMKLSLGPYRRWPAPDTIEAWATLKRTEQAFSDSSRSGMQAAFMSFAASDAGKIVGVSYVFGREAIGSDFEKPPPGFTGIMWHATHGTVAGSNDLGFNVGPVRSRPDASGRNGASGGQFMTIWRRQPDGEWRWVVD